MTPPMPVIDALDGSPAATTVAFSLDGVRYQIDLSEANAQRLRQVLAEFVAAARRVGRRRSRRRPGASAQAGQIRTWAVRTGYQVSSRGRLPAHVVAAYHLAHTH